MGRKGWKRRGDRGGALGGEGLVGCGYQAEGGLEGCGCQAGRGKGPYLPGRKGVKGEAIRERSLGWLGLLLLCTGHNITGY